MVRWKTMYNEELVKKGLAREKYFSPNGKYRSTFEKDEQQAKKIKWIFGVKKWVWENILDECSPILIF